MILSVRIFGATSLVAILLLLSTALSAATTETVQTSVVFKSGDRIGVAAASLKEVRKGDRFELIAPRGSETSDRHDVIGLLRVEAVSGDTAIMEVSRHRTPVVPKVDDAIVLRWLEPGRGPSWGNRRMYIAPHVAVARYWSEPMDLGTYASGSSSEEGVTEFSGSTTTFKKQAAAGLPAVGLTLGIAFSDRMEICIGGDISGSTSEFVRGTYDGLGHERTLEYSDDNELEFAGAMDLRCRVWTYGRASFLLKGGAWLGNSHMWNEFAIGSTLGLGVRFAVSNRFSVLVEADRRDNWMEKAGEEDEFLCEGGDTQIRFRIHPELVLMSW